MSFLSQIKSSNNTVVDWAVLSKFGVDVDLDIAKRVMSIKSKPRIDSQLHGRNFENWKIVMT